MFKLFGKKKDDAPRQAPKSQPQSEEFRALAADFRAEELDLVAVTGASGFGGGKLPGQALWTATLPLTAWMEEDGPVHREETTLVALADDKLLDYLRQRVPRDFIIKFRARPALDASRFLMADLPQPGFDPELKAILDEQKKPVTLEAEGLGIFSLNRTVNWFQADAAWLGQPIQLTFDRGEAEEMSAAQDTARALMAGQADWDGRVRAYAAEALLSLANDWAQDGGEEDQEPEEITREQFMARMELESIQVYGDGRFEFWFNDGELFWGHSIHVTGSLDRGPDWAQMEG